MKLKPLHLFECRGFFFAPLGGGSRLSALFFLVSGGIGGVEGLGLELSIGYFYFWCAQK